MTGSASCRLLRRAMRFALRPPRYLVPMIVACALFMENMDATVIATATRMYSPSVPINSRPM